MVFGREIDRKFQKNNVPLDILKEYPEAMPDKGSPEYIRDTLTGRLVAVLDEDRIRAKWKVEAFSAIEEDYTAEINEPLSVDKLRIMFDAHIDKRDARSKAEFDEDIKTYDAETQAMLKRSMDETEAFINTTDIDAELPDIKSYVCDLMVEAYDWAAQLQHLLGDLKLDLGSDFDVNFTFKDPVASYNRIVNKGHVDILIDSFEIIEFRECIYLFDLQKFLIYITSFFFEYRKAISLGIKDTVDQFKKKLDSDAEMDEAEFKEFLERFNKLRNAYPLLVSKQNEIAELSNKLVYWPYQPIGGVFAKMYKSEKKKFRDAISFINWTGKKDLGVGDIYAIYGSIFEELESFFEKQLQENKDVASVVKIAVKGALSLDGEVVKKSKKKKESCELQLQAIKKLSSLLEREGVSDSVMAYAAYATNARALFSSNTYRELIEDDQENKSIEKYPPEILLTASEVHSLSSSSTFKNKTYEGYLYSERYLLDLDELNENGVLNDYLNVFKGGDERVKGILSHPSTIGVLAEFGKHASEMLEILADAELSSMASIVKNKGFYAKSIKNLLINPELLEVVCAFEKTEDRANLLEKLKCGFFECPERSGQFIEFAQIYQRSPKMFNQVLDLACNETSCEPAMFLLSAKSEDAKYLIDVAEMLKQYGLRKFRRLRYVYTKELNDRLQELGFVDGENLLVDDDAFKKISRFKEFLDEVDISKKDQKEIGRYTCLVGQRSVNEALYFLQSKLSLDFLDDFDFLDDIDYGELVIGLSRINLNLLDKLIREGIHVTIAQNLSQDFETTLEFLDKLKKCKKVGKGLKATKKWMESFISSEAELFIERYKEKIEFVFKDEAFFILEKIEAKGFSTKELNLISKVVDLFEVLIHTHKISDKFINLLGERIFNGQFKIVELMIEFLDNGYNVAAIEWFLEFFEADEYVDEMADDYAAFIEAQESILEKEQLAELMRRRELQESQKEHPDENQVEASPFKDKKILILVGNYVSNFDSYREAAVSNGGEDVSVAAISKLGHRSKGNINSYLANYDFIFIMVGFMGHKDTDKIKSSIPDSTYCESSSLGASGLKRILGNLEL